MVTRGWLPSGAVPRGASVSVSMLHLSSHQPPQDGFTAAAAQPARGLLATHCGQYEHRRVPGASARWHIAPPEQLRPGEGRWGDAGGLAPWACHTSGAARRPEVQVPEGSEVAVVQRPD